MSHNKAASTVQGKEIFHHLYIDLILRISGTSLIKLYAIAPTHPKHLSLVGVRSQTNSKESL